MATRPDSRSAAFPTAAPLPPPPRLRFEAVWERDLPGESVVHLLSDGETVVCLSAGGRLRSLRVSDGEPLWSAEGIDPAFEPSLRRGVVVVQRVSDGATMTFDAVDGSEGVPVTRITDIRTAEGALKAVAQPGAFLEMRDEARRRVLWRVRTGTNVGAEPVILDTSPGGGEGGARRKPESMVIAGTMDGLLMAFGMRNGHLLWTKRMDARLSRPIAVWLDPDDPGADRTRLLVAAEASGRLDAVRAIDGASAGSLVLEPVDAVVIAGPVVSAGHAGAPRQNGSGTRSAPSPVSCVIAWSPYLPAGSRVLALRLSSGG